MAFRFEKSNCVVVGTFNMYILHPQWLAKREIIERGIEVAIETNFTRPGFKFVFPKLDQVWVIGPNRVVVESRDPQVDCGSYVAKMLRALPETPLQGLGNNVTYVVEPSAKDDLAPAIRDFPLAANPSADETVAQHTFHVGVKRGKDQVTNLQLSFNEKQIELACNVHLSLENRDDANAAAVAAASRFFDDRTHAKSLAQHFFGMAALP